MLLCIAVGGVKKKKKIKRHCKSTVACRPSTKTAHTVKPPEIFGDIVAIRVKTMKRARFSPTKETLTVLLHPHFLQQIGGQ